ncbi:hypothetical protein [Puia dinghuensis]|uniref:SusC/RagA family TonB-linked outer membrane protein n=1 Tax=Puia dinghuensis TaxID=1792502 RepID=A0A8J2XWZ0_9BACT|nr:hypothetical protein [Puia dinghuensis]GGB26299.1 hypothetical protein GCM10011511_57810 [Puia dinghuensis]
MSRFVLVAVALCLLVPPMAVAQPTNIHFRNTPLIKVLDSLQKLYPFDFYYCNRDVQFVRADLDIDGEDFPSVYKKLMADLPFRDTPVYKAGFYTVVLHHIDTLPLSGRIYDDQGEPQIKITVRNLRTKEMTTTDSLGGFELKPVVDSDTLDISGVSVEGKLVSIDGKRRITIVLHRRIRNMDAATVTRHYPNGFVDTGVTAASSPGAYSFMDSISLSRVVATNWEDHIAVGMSGLYSGVGTGNASNMIIRGLNSLVTHVAPTMVLDNFPYFASRGDLNPYDLSSVTLLKDEVAASGWGYVASGGVLVLTTPRGEYNTPFQVQLIENTTVTGAPDLHYIPRMSSTSYISAETLLFNRGYYNTTLNAANVAITPVVQILSEWGHHTLTDAQANTRLQQLAAVDPAATLRKYYYRSRVAQQLHLSLTGGCATRKYWFSLGYDQDPTDLIRNRYQRLTAHLAYTEQLIPKKLELSTIVQLTTINQRLNNPGALPVAYPYAVLADAAGDALPVAYKYNPGYLDTVGHGALPDWHYYPLTELHLANNRLSHLLFYGQSTLDYKLSSRLSLTLLYRYLKSHASLRDDHSKDGFFVHDLYNTNAQVNGPVVYSPIALEDILDRSDSVATEQNGRAQLLYSLSSRRGYQLKAYAGAEWTEQSTTGQTSRTYGYTNGDLSSFANYYSYLSLYSNAALTWRNLYSVYGAFRRDASNIVGVSGNRDWASFWSLGLSGELIRSTRQKAAFPPLLKVRITYGCDGNVPDRTGYLAIQSLGNNNYGALQSGIANPPEPGLQWEKTYMLNMGLDFALLRNKRNEAGRFSGSLDLFWKRSVNVLGNDTLPPSAGVAAFLVNNAILRGRGLDLVMNSVNIPGKWRWESRFLLSVAVDWISRYPLQPSSPASYVTGRFPMTGKPPSALYSYDWGGLNSQTGDPQGSLGHKVSTSYAALMNDQQGAFHYSGSYLPEVYGSLLNMVSWRQWNLSANIIFKAAYCFRRPSINYSQVIEGFSPGVKDYEWHWQAPGDEKHTSVPSFPIVVDANRDAFYQNSAVLITRGDQVRLQDLRISYTVGSSRTLAFRQLEIYAYAANLGILWRANHYGIDPDAANLGDLPVMRSYSLGVRANF